MPDTVVQVSEDEDEGNARNMTMPDMFLWKLVCLIIPVLLILIGTALILVGCYCCHAALGTNFNTDSVYLYSRLGSCLLGVGLVSVGLAVFQLVAVSRQSILAVGAFVIVCAITGLLVMLLGVELSRKVEKWAGDQELHKNFVQQAIAQASNFTYFQKAINRFQTVYQCCGFSGYQDWNNNNTEFTCVDNSTKCKLPDSCCTTAKKCYQPIANVESDTLSKGCSMHVRSFILKLPKMIKIAAVVIGLVLLLHCLPCSVLCHMFKTATVVAYWNRKKRKERKLQRQQDREDRERRRREKRRLKYQDLQVV